MREELKKGLYSCRATGSSPVSGTRIGVSSLRASPRKKALNRTAQAIISGNAEGETVNARFTQPW
jgi:hypothetical protein